MKEEKTIEMELKLSLKHPRKFFRLGRYKITKQLSPYELNEAEVKELEGKGPTFWLRTSNQAKKAKNRTKKKA